MSINCFRFSCYSDSDIKLFYFYPAIKNNNFYNIRINTTGTHTILFIYMNAHLYTTYNKPNNCEIIIPKIK